MYSVYLMHRDDGIFKFGISKNPNKRKNNLKKEYHQKYTVIFETEKKYSHEQALFIESYQRLFFFSFSSYSRGYNNSLDHFYLTKNKNFSSLTIDFINNISIVEKMSGGE